MAEASFAATKHAIEDLWAFAKLRGRAFQDILGLIEAAIKHKDISEFNVHQRDALRLAFVNLAKYFIDDDDASDHRLRFAQTGIDILGPLQNRSDCRLRITVERIHD